LRRTQGNLKGIAELTIAPHLSGFLRAGPTVVLLKAALSALQGAGGELGHTAPRYRAAAEVLLADAAMLVQDDTGFVAEALLAAEAARGGWRLAVLGRFNAAWTCMGSCPGRETDPGLRPLYAERGQAPLELPFKFGYHKAATMLVLAPPPQLVEPW
jgi:hypothetical protein